MWPLGDGEALVQSGRVTTGQPGSRSVRPYDSVGGFSPFRTGSGSDLLHKMGGSGS